MIYDLQINTCRKVLLQVKFLDDDILHCLLWVLSFYENGHRIKSYIYTQSKNPFLLESHLTKSPGTKSSIGRWLTGIMSSVLLSTTPLLSSPGGTVCKFHMLKEVRVRGRLCTVWCSCFSRIRRYKDDFWFFMLFINQCWTSDHDT